jgi:hypothetical protein
VHLQAVRVALRLLELRQSAHPDGDKHLGAHLGQVVESC